MADKTRGDMRIAVLAGGISDEREISRNSGKNVCAALAEAGFGTVEMLDPADDGFIDQLRGGSFDVAFIAMHGKGGEDGQIQSVLEYCHIPYTGSGVIASACAADKAVSKALYERAGIPVARDCVVEAGSAVDPAAGTGGGEPRLLADARAPLARGREPFYGSQGGGRYAS